MYEISYKSDGEIISDSLNITVDADFKIMANNVTTSLNDLVVDKHLAKADPNPTTDHLIY